MGIKINKRSLALFLLFLDFSDQPLVRRRGQSGTLVSKLRVKVLKESCPDLVSVSFTTDMWTNREGDAFISLTIHYIDK